jgi:hypothetical protein
MMVRKEGSCCTTCAVLAAALLVATAPSGRAALPLLDGRDMKLTREALEGNAAQLAQISESFPGLLTGEDRRQLKAIARLPDDEAVGAIQEMLDRHALALVHIDEEAWFTVSPATHDPKERRLTRGRWTTYLIKVHNESRVTSPLEVRSSEAITVVVDSQELEKFPSCEAPSPRDWRRWLHLRLTAPPGMKHTLSGREIEYFVLQACSPYAGTFSANLVFYLGGGQVSQGHYADTSMLFLVDEGQNE